MTIDRVSGGFLALLGFFVLWERRVLPLGTHQQPGPGYFPFLLAVLLIVLGGILLLRGGQSKPFRSLKWPEAPHAVAILGCSVFATLFMEWIGYRITMFLILGFLFGIMERIRIWQTLTLTLALSLGTFWVFDSLLRVPLPRGGWGF
jgi:putative tricarboxylic transport membrane protein